MNENNDKMAELEGKRDEALLEYFNAVKEVIDKINEIWPQLNIKYTIKEKD